MEVQQQPGESFEGLLRRCGRTIIKAGILGEAKRAKQKAAERKKRRKSAREAARAADPGRRPARPR